MKTFTITELADAHKIVAQVADGEPTVILDGSKAVVMRTVENDERERSGYYCGTHDGLQKRLVVPARAETEKDRAMIRAAIKAVRIDLLLVLRAVYDIPIVKVDSLLKFIS